MQRTEPITAERVEAGDREIRIAWQDCSPRLATATPQQRRNAELSPGGYGVHWPMIDEDLSISGLLRDSGNVG